MFPVPCATGGWGQTCVTPSDWHYSVGQAAGGAGLEVYFALESDFENFFAQRVFSYYGDYTACCLSPGTIFTYIPGGGTWTFADSAQMLLVCGPLFGTWMLPSAARWGSAHCDITYTVYGGGEDIDWTFKGQGPFWLGPGSYCPFPVPSSLTPIPTTWQCATPNGCAGNTGAAGSGFCCSESAVGNCRSCDSNGNCASCALGYYPTSGSLPSSSCSSLLGAGSWCPFNAACSSGYCTGYYCCSSSTTAANCYACDGTGGCSPGYCATGFYVNHYGACAAALLPGSACLTQLTDPNQCGSSAVCLAGTCCVDAAVPNCVQCGGSGTCSQCADGYYSVQGTGVCAARKAAGSGCSTPGECASTACRGGVCCSAAASAHCSSCSGSDGACVVCDAGATLTASGSCAVPIAGAAGMTVEQRIIAGAASAGASAVAAAAAYAWRWIVRRRWRRRDLQTHPIYTRVRDALNLEIPNLTEGGGPDFVAAMDSLAAALAARSVAITPDVLRLDHQRDATASIIADALRRPLSAMATPLVVPDRGWLSLRSWTCGIAGGYDLRTTDMKGVMELLADRVKSEMVLQGVVKAVPPPVALPSVQPGQAGAASDSLSSTRSAAVALALGKMPGKGASAGTKSGVSANNVGEDPMDGVAVVNPLHATAADADGR